MTSEYFLRVTILRLEARKVAALDYSMNTVMHIEAGLLEAEIRVLEEELRRITP